MLLIYIIRISFLFRIIDSGGGFLIEEDNTVPIKVRKVEEPAPVISGELTLCLECDKPFLDSYLLRTYDYSVCDKCRDSEEKHSVITKTQAKVRDLVPKTFFKIILSRRKCYNENINTITFFLALKKVFAVQSKFCVYVYFQEIKMRRFGEILLVCKNHLQKSTFILCFQCNNYRNCYVSGSLKFAARRP